MVGKLWGESVYGPLWLFVDSWCIVFGWLEVSFMPTDEGKLGWARGGLVRSNLRDTLVVVMGYKGLDIGLLSLTRGESWPGEIVPKVVGEW